MGKLATILAKLRFTKSREAENNIDRARIEATGSSQTGQRHARVGSNLKVARLLTEGSSRISDQGGLVVLKLRKVHRVFDASSEPVAVFIQAPDNHPLQLKPGSPASDADGCGFVCWYANSAAAELHGCSSLGAFKDDYVLQQLQHQPALSSMLEHLSRRSTKEQRTHASSIYLPKLLAHDAPPSAVASFITLEAALMIYYSPVHADPRLMNHLAFDNTCLGQVPCSVTVFSFEGQVLHQNASSIAYMGHAVDEDQPIRIDDPEHPLRRLFSSRPGSFDEIWSSMKSGEDWTGRVRMPTASSLDNSLFQSQKQIMTSEATTTAAAAEPVAAPFSGYLDEPSINTKKEAARANSRRSSITACCLFPDTSAEFPAVPPTPGQQVPQTYQPSTSWNLTPKESLALAPGPSWVTMSTSREQASLWSNRAAVSMYEEPLACLTEEEPGGWAISAATMFDDTDDDAEQPNPFKKPARRASTLSEQLMMSSSPEITAGAGPESKTLASCPSKPLPGRRMSVRRQASVTFSVSSDWTAANRVMRMVSDRRMSRDYGSPCSTPGPATDSGVPTLSSASDAQPGGAEGQESNAWFDVQASRLVDPGTGKPVILLVQTDVTAVVQAEEDMQRILNAEHALLEQVFPKHVLEVMAVDKADQSNTGATTHMCTPQNASSLARSHPEVTVMFADIVTYTDMCRQIDPHMVMDFLNRLFTQLDDLVEKHGVYKVETVGDCYMVAGGLTKSGADGGYEVDENYVDPEHGRKVLAFANAMLDAASGVMLPTTGTPVQIRVGIHTGPVVSGVIGKRMPRFGLFGDTVNTASRMESNSQPGRIHVSAAAKGAIGEQPPGGTWVPTGGIQVKGKGLMDTFFYEASI